MAINQITTDITELESQRLGYMGMSLNNWTDTNVDAYGSGGKFECGGSLFDITTNTIMGTAGEWAGIANSTLLYSYYNPTDNLFHFTITAPTWSTSKQGWYGTAGAATYRYFASIYKDAGGLYTQKTLFMSRSKGITCLGLSLGSQAANADHEIRLATDASILWDESEDAFYTDKPIHQSGSSYYSGALGITYGVMYDMLVQILPNVVNSWRIISGGVHIGGADRIVYMVIKTSPTQLTLRCVNAADIVLAHGGASTLDAYMSW
jgi:hypothetical protein